MIAFQLTKRLARAVRKDPPLPSYESTSNTKTDMTGGGKVSLVISGAY